MGRSRLLVFGIAVLVLAAWTSTAQAAGISLQGSTWVYTDAGSEVNNVSLSFGQEEDAADVTHTVVKFGDYVSITYPTSHCFEAPGGWVACKYSPGQSARLDLGGGNDFLGISDLPAAMAVTANGGDGDDDLRDDSDAVTALRTFTGGAGNDEVLGYSGPDHMDGGPGNDKLDGGADADTVLGGDGNDELAGDKYAAPAPDVIDGGAGFDAVDEWSQPSENVNPFVSVTQEGQANDGRPGEGDNVTGIEKITAHSAGLYQGTSGNDDIWVWANVGTGASTIRGLEGDDKLTGLDQPETIDGGPGDDVLQGGFGDDDITGGPGRDRILGDGGSSCDYFGCTVPFGNDTIRARDGEADSIDCGLGTDTAIVDPVDTVAGTCETVDVGSSGGSGTGTGGGSGTGSGGQSGQALQLKAPSTQSIRALLKNGMRVSVVCPAACRVDGKLSYKGRKIAAGRRTLLDAGTAAVSVKVSKKARRQVRRLRKGTLLLSVTMTDKSGTATSATRKIKIKR